MRYSRECLGHYVQYFARNYANRPAIAYYRGFRTHRYTYAQFHDCCRRTSVYLLQEGFAKGDRILVCGGNGVEWASLLMAAALTGVVLVPVDATAPRDLVERIAEATTPRAIVTDRGDLGTMHSIPCWDLDSLLDRVAGCDPAALDAIDGYVGGDDVYEILYTSGTTQEPKGAVIRHRNISNNLRSLQMRIRYQPEWRLLSVLPLSHVFEQIVGTYAALRYGCEIVYHKRQSPSDIARILRTHPISAVVAVPAVLATLRRRIEETAVRRGKAKSLARLLKVCSRLPFEIRRLATLSVRRAFGQHLAVFISGGGPLCDTVWTFWESLGIRVTQGYGLTEAACVVACNTYDERVCGSVGRALRGQHVRIAGDGEIEIAGENVIDGYFQRPDLDRELFGNGWYRTGDIGRLDSRGNLFITGRKKSMIVGPSGLNVFPEDIEAVLGCRPGVRECVVFDPDGSASRLVGAVIGDGCWDTAALRRSVNAALQPHQALAEVIVWPDERFPSTPTRKIVRRDVVARYREFAVKPAGQAVPAKPAGTLGRVICAASAATGLPVSELTPAMTLGHDLGLDSLKLVQLTLELETALARPIDESQLRLDMTLEQVAQATETMPTEPDRARAEPARLGAVSRATGEVLFGALRAALRVGFGVRVKVRGSSPASPHSPVIYVANHASHLDTIGILAALPAHQRARTVVAAAQDYFFDGKPVVRALGSLCLHMFPFCRTGRMKRNLSTIGSYLDRGMSVLLFPEGTRSRSGVLGPFKGGIGTVVTEARVPVVPIGVVNAHALWPHDRRLPARGTVEVRFGQTWRCNSETPQEISGKLETAVRSLLE